MADDIMREVVIYFYGYTPYSLAVIEQEKMSNTKLWKQMRPKIIEARKAIERVLDEK